MDCSRNRHIFAHFNQRSLESRITDTVWYSERDNRRCPTTTTASHAITHTLALSHFVLMMTNQYSLHVHTLLPWKMSLICVDWELTRRHTLSAATMTSVKTWIAGAVCVRLRYAFHGSCASWHCSWCVKIKFSVSIITFINKHEREMTASSSNVSVENVPEVSGPGIWPGYGEAERKTRCRERWWRWFEGWRGEL